MNEAAEAATPIWLLELLAAVRPLLPREFVGQIELNCFRGNVANVNVRQSFKETPMDGGRAC